MAELLFEIFSEEIPARMQLRAGNDLVRLMDAALKEAGLSPSGSYAMTGPRRLTYVTDIETRSPDVSEERKGPRVGSHEKAIQGFMRGAGISDISQAEIRSDKKGEFYVAVIQSEGGDTVDILRDAIPSVMGDFPWPKSMKSADSDFRWVRPLRGLTVLLDGKSVDGITVGGMTSDGQVHGHRHMGPGPFTVTSLADYRAQLEGDGHVYLDRDQRKTMILEQAQSVCTQASLELVEDQGLLDEVAGLVEYPVALLGDMDPDFLKLPDEVIRLTLKSHQKTFTVRDPKTGKLAAHFVILANLETPDQGATIKAGNAKVISARLADARFFQDEDRKKKLQDYYDQLDEVVFHKKLGSVRDKAERVAALAKDIAPHVGANPILAEKAARLAKCDLVTQTVIEATSLQGKVGRWMYEYDVSLGRADTHPTSSGRLDRPAHLPTTDGSGDGFADQVGESGEWGEADHAAIAVAIEEHYKPQGPSDAVPTEPVAVAVALADKIDTLVGFWAIDEKPTGSKDPYALRRAALGVVRIIDESRAHVSLMLDAFANSFARAYVHINAVMDDQLAEVVADALRTKFVDQKFADQRISEHEQVRLEQMISDEKMSQAQIDAQNLLSFLLDRLRVYLRDQGQRHDVIDAVIAQGGDDLLAIAQRVEALGAFLSDGDGEDLVQGYKRAANILRAETKKTNKPVIPAKPRSGAEPGPDGTEASQPGTMTSGPGSALQAVRDDKGRYTAPEATALAQVLFSTMPAIDTALASANYPAALSALADLREPIDAFFENVVVNSDDAAERARRLALLSAIVETFHQIADFSRLDG